MGVYKANLDESIRIRGRGPSGLDDLQLDVLPCVCLSCVSQELCPRKECNVSTAFGTCVANCRENPGTSTVLVFEVVCFIGGDASEGIFRVCCFGLLDGPH